MILPRAINGIDPGTTHSGVAVLRCSTRFCTIQGWQRYENESLLQALRENITSVPIAVEDVSCYGMPVGRDVFETVKLVGRIQEIAYQRDQKVILIPRREIRVELCGSMRAGGSEVRQALIDRFGGNQKAIGGIKCPACHGKGWRGRGRPTCTECEGGRWAIPPGPLHPRSGLAGHAWDALAVAVVASDRMQREETRGGR